MAQIVTDAQDRKFLFLWLAVVHDPSDPTATEGSWCAYVANADSPLAGLFAFGASLDEVRDSVVVRAWAAILQGELHNIGINVPDLAGIQVTTTMTTGYDALALACAVTDDAA